MSEDYEFDPDFKHKIPPEKPAGFFESLFYAKWNVEKLTPEEMEWENERNFVDGYQSVTGPLKWLSEEEKDAIHSLIDVKMQELEDSGLTWEEILHNRVGEGMTLRDDMFF